MIIHTEFCIVPWGHVGKDSHGDWDCRDWSQQGEREETTGRGEGILHQPHFTPSAMTGPPSLVFAKSWFDRCYRDLLLHLWRGELLSHSQMTRMLHCVQRLFTVCHLLSQGLLRYVPIVGSVLNWFSPPTPTTPEGRTFNLSSGLWYAHRFICHE